MKENLKRINDTIFNSLGSINLYKGDDLRILNMQGKIKEALYHRLFNIPDRYTFGALPFSSDIYSPNQYLYDTERFFKALGDKYKDDFEWNRLQIGSDSCIDDWKYYLNFTWDVTDIFNIGLAYFFSASADFDKIDETDIYDAADCFNEYEDTENDEELTDYKQELILLYEDMKKAHKTGETDNDYLESFADDFISQFLPCTMTNSCFYKNIEVFLSFMCTDCSRCFYVFSSRRLGHYLANKSTYKNRNAAKRLNKLIKTICSDIRCHFMQDEESTTLYFEYIDDEDACNDIESYSLHALPHNIDFLFGQILSCLDELHIA